MSRYDRHRMEALSLWDYAALWQTRDREAWGAAYDAYASETSYPKIHKRECPRRNCVRGDTLDVCHHDVEEVLRGSGKFSERWVKNERNKWHPDRWSTKSEELKVMAKEMFQLIQRVIESEENKPVRE